MEETIKKEYEARVCPKCGEPVCPPEELYCCSCGYRLDGTDKKVRFALDKEMFSEPEDNETELSYEVEEED